MISSFSSQQEKYVYIYIYIHIYIYTYLFVLSYKQAKQRKQTPKPVPALRSLRSALDPLASCAARTTAVATFSPTSRIRAVQGSTDSDWQDAAARRARAEARRQPKDWKVSTRLAQGNRTDGLKWCPRDGLKWPPALVVWY